MRSRHIFRSVGDNRARITSACAEQTTITNDANATWRDHLRVCGADTVFALTQMPSAGSPPRVRSRPRVTFDADTLVGITSACAEQTAILIRIEHILRDHLRVCGADFQNSTPTFSRLGSPPRVRSRPNVSRGDIVQVGITSACAEQTWTTTSSRGCGGDHLRVCGADPPLVARLCLYRGITSACAEQTLRAWA